MAEGQRILDQLEKAGSFLTYAKPLKNRDEPLESAGKIFITDVDRAIRIRTGETQEDAL